MAQSLKIMKTLLYVCLISCLPGMAQAAAITNLTEKPQVIEIRVRDEFATYVIEPGRTFRTVGYIEVRQQGNERYTHIRNNEEFAIWENGGIWPQRRFNSTRNRL